MVVNNSKQKMVVNDSLQKMVVNDSLLEQRIVYSGKPQGLIVILLLLEPTLQCSRRLITHG